MLGIFHPPGDFSEKISTNKLYYAITVDKSSVDPPILDMTHLPYRVLGDRKNSMSLMRYL